MITVIGSNGQLGWELVKRGNSKGFKVLSLDYPEIDITDPESIRDRISSKEIVCVINAAAYTAVDKAESELERAFAVNRDGPAYLAHHCRNSGLPLVHISTDYVFDGSKTTAYNEQDLVVPLGIYGESKAGGEMLVRQNWSNHIILRTAWLYGVHGQNFVKTILRLGRERSTLRVVDDQLGCPTYAADLADAILAIVERIKVDNFPSWGTYHCCGGGSTSWHGFAEAILAFGGRYEELAVKDLIPIKTTEYPLPAKRPANSVFDCRKIERNFNIKLRPWKDALQQMISELYSV
jgi:dTDP-4-dehydrorhamnose reductase